MKVVIVGGGIAGLATAAALAESNHEIILVEREAQLFAHSSGKNAAIYKPLETEEPLVDLALKSAAVLDDLCAELGEPWLRPSGLLLTTSAPGRLVPLERSAQRCKLPHTGLTASEAVAYAPLLEGGSTEQALWLPTAGVLDVHVMHNVLRRRTLATGARIRAGAEVLRVEQNSGRVCGVWLGSDERLQADAVVLAAGAWNSALGRACETPLLLIPLRRHLVQLQGVEPTIASEPVVWDVSEPVYFRPEGQGYLASPCDEQAQQAGVVATSPDSLELLHDKLTRVAPGLSSAGVRRAWACLRTFAPDRLPVVGPDPRLEGLYWIAGLGGFGMTIGVTLGALLAQRIRQQDVQAQFPYWRELAPERLLGPDSGASHQASPSART